MNYCFRQGEIRHADSLQYALNVATNHLPSESRIGAASGQFARHRLPRVGRMLALTLRALLTVSKYRECAACSSGR